MNAQERDQLQQFLATLRQQRVQAKDPVAAGLIRDALASQADATYLLVQRAMALSLALQASQNRWQQLQALSAEALQASNPVASAAPAQAPEHLSVGGAQTAQPSLWMRGLVGQVGGTALGVAAGVVAGGAVLQGLQALWGDDAPPPASVLGSNSADGLSTPTEGDGLWDLGDDWT